MKTNLFIILSEILKEQLVKKIVVSGNNLKEIASTKGIEINKLVDILGGKCSDVIITELSNILDYCEFEITTIIAMAKYSSKLSFDFIIDKDLFSLN
ncbi:MAG: hypothetical protein HRF52_11785 [Ignavibacterium sp.]|jgi:hypothetical protein|uniref:hypothetical protein n=1 Tax=Ignavibacterium sp. TaxID=2651167 RepID=UPI0032990BAB